MEFSAETQSTEQERQRIARIICRGKQKSRKVPAHTVRCDTTRCGVSGVGHAAKRQSPTFPLNLSRLLLDDIEPLPRDHLLVRMRLENIMFLLLFEWCYVIGLCYIAIAVAICLKEKKEIK